MVSGFLLVRKDRNLEVPTRKGQELVADKDGRVVLRLVVSVLPPFS